MIGKGIVSAMNNSGGGLKYISSANIPEDNRFDNMMRLATSKPNEAGLLSASGSGMENVRAIAGAAIGGAEAMFDNMQGSLSQTAAKALAVGGAVLEAYDTVNFLRNLSCPAGSWQAQAATAIQVGKVYVTAVGTTLGGLAGAAVGRVPGAFVGAAAAGAATSYYYDGFEKSVVHNLGCD